MPIKDQIKQIITDLINMDKHAGLDSETMNNVIDNRVELIMSLTRSMTYEPNQ